MSAWIVLSMNPRWNIGFPAFKNAWLCSKGYILIKDYTFKLGNKSLLEQKHMSGFCSKCILGCQTLTATRRWIMRPFSQCKIILINSTDRFTSLFLPKCSWESQYKVVDNLLSCQKLYTKSLHILIELIFSKSFIVFSVYLKGGKSILLKPHSKM